MSGSTRLIAVVGGIAAGAVAGTVALLLLMPAVRPSGDGTRPAPPAVTPPAANASGVPAVGSEPVQANGPAALAPAASAVDPAALQRLLESSAEELPGKVAIHVRIDGGPEAGVLANEQMRAASVIKLPLLAVLFAAWESGLVKRTSADLERARKMITQSANPEADALIRRLGMDRVNDWLDNHGYTGTELRHLLLGERPRGENVVSAAEMTRMLLEIGRGELVSPAASAEMRQILQAQTRRTRIPAGLPEEAVVGNKTGTLNGVVNDVALVEAPGLPRYAIAVLNEGGSDVATSRRIAELSRKVYQLLRSSAAPESASGNGPSSAAPESGSGTAPPAGNRP
ncbi:MAG: serine hydrolase [Armatimonadota bacterium]